MKLLLLGATGRTGSNILEQAISRGFEMNVLVRNPGKILISSEKLTVFEGTPENAEDVRRAMACCDAVIVALNINRKSDSPWAKIISPINLIRQKCYCVHEIARDRQSHHDFRSRRFVQGNTGYFKMDYKM